MSHSKKFQLKAGHAHDSNLPAVTPERTNDEGKTADAQDSLNNLSRKATIKRAVAENSKPGHCAQQE